MGGWEVIGDLLMVGCKQITRRLWELLKSQLPTTSFHLFSRWEKNAGRALNESSASGADVMSFKIPDLHLTKI